MSHFNVGPDRGTNDISVQECVRIDLRAHESLAFKKHVYFTTQQNNDLLLAIVS